MIKQVDKRLQRYRGLSVPESLSGGFPESLADAEGSDGGSGVAVQRYADSPGTCGPLGTKPG